MFRNLIVSLTATGQHAVIIILMLCMAAVGIWGEGSLAASALTGLLFLAYGLLSQVKR